MNRDRAPAELGSDDRLRLATVRLLAKDGGLAGTGFMVTGDGRLITCHHVAVGDQPVAILDSEGGQWTGRRCSTEAVLHGADIAIVQLSAEPGRAFPPPLPILDFCARDVEVRSRVSLTDTANFRDSVPVSGELGGAVKIVYRGEASYSVRGQTIRGLKVESGMSGAALWNDQLDAAIGVVAVSSGRTPNLDGFGILFSEASPSPEFAKIAEANDEAVARDGTHPNRKGLRRLLRRASDRTVRRLCDRGIVFAENFVPREGAEEALFAFVRSGDPSFPIVAAAAHGKTSLMAAFAANATLPPTLLVRGADVKEGEPPVTALERFLREADIDEPASLASLAERSDARPLLLLDGLNEIPLPAHIMAKEWLPDLVGLVRESGWKLVFTTRPELFDHLRDSNVAQAFFKPQATGEPGTSGHFVLGQYTAEEAQQAVEAYQVSRRLSRNIGRHPMMVRLASDPHGPFDRRSQILQRLLDTLMRAVRDLGLDLHPTVIDRLLVAMAQRTHELRGVLPFDDPLVERRELVGALRQENVLEEIPAGYRFVFDEIRDYLLALGLARRVEEAGTHLGIDDLDFAPDVVALAAEVLDNGASPALAGKWLEAIVIRGEAGQDHGHGLSVAAALPRSSRFDPLKQLFVETLISASTRNNFILGSERSLSLAFPAPAFDRLLWWAIFKEHGYGWREKDVWSNWHRGSIVIGRAEVGAPRLVLELLDDEERDGAGLLIAWLDDATHLDGGKYQEATVGSFALCMLWSFRHRIGLARLFADVIMAERKGAGSLMDALAEEEPGPFVEMLEASDDDAIVASFPTVRACWDALLRAEANDGDKALRERAGAFFSRLTDKVPLLEVQEILVLASSYGFPLGSDPAPLIDAVAEAGLLHQSTLVGAVNLGWMELDDALALAARSCLVHDFVWSFVSSWNPSRRVTLRQIAALIGDHVGNGASDGFTLTHAIELVAWQAELPAAMESGFCDVLTRLVEGHREVITRALAHPAAARTPPLPGGQLAFRKWLLDLIFANSMPHDLRTQLLVSLTKTRPSLEENLDRAVDLACQEDARFLGHLAMLADKDAHLALAGLLAGLRDRDCGFSPQDLRLLADIEAILRRTDISGNSRGTAIHERLLRED